VKKMPKPKSIGPKKTFSRVHIPGYHQAIVEELQLIDRSVKAGRIGSKRGEELKRRALSDAKRFLQAVRTPRKER